MLIKSESVMTVKKDNLTSVEEQENELEGCGNGRKLLELSSGDNSQRNLKTSSQLEVTEITPHLLLCGAVALRGNILEDLKVTCVINATKELPDTPLPTTLQDEILYLRVNVDDRTDSNILPWMDIVADIIHQVRAAGGKTLIHCMAGISRSATLCLAYLIKYEGLTLHDSYFMLKALRQIIRPNSGFFGQLIEFEKRITGKQTVLMVMSDYTKSYIPQLYEEDFHKFYNRKYRRARP